MGITSGEQPQDSRTTRWPVLGVAYYHEYQPYPRLDTDLDLMVAAGISVIRVGESVWSTWEPCDGVFDVDWLRPVLDGADRHGIGVLLGTPTYAIPPWLARRYPEVLAQRRTGVPIPYGHRQDVDYTHPAFRFHAERVVRKILETYATHPAVFGFQVDNEPGLELPHNPGTFARFVDHLKAQYETVEQLNRAWGLTYWSHRLSRWEDLWAPDGNTTPGYALAWRRYQAAATTEFITWQAAIVREYARPEQLITTCFAQDRPALSTAATAAALDIAAVNIYYATQDALTEPAGSEVTRPPAPFSRGRRGPWSIAYEADRARGIKHAPFLVTETNATSIGESHYNFPCFDGQWRQVAWLLIARGALLVSYWHWHTLHYGHEMFWGGVLGHDLQPGRCYAELARISAELAKTGPLLDGLRPTTDAAILWSDESRWALEFAPPLAVPGTNLPDRGSYQQMVGAFYRACFDANISVDFLDVDRLSALRPADVPMLLVPALYIADDAVLCAVERYAAAGGHVVIGPRTGYAGPDAAARHHAMPGPLRQAVGASYQEYTNLVTTVPLATTPDGPMPTDARAQLWAERLSLEGATVLARYGAGVFQGQPAVTTHGHGSGRVTYLATIPDDVSLQEIIAWARPATATPPLRTPPSVRTATAINAAGQRLRWWWNWSATPTDISIPDKANDALSGAALDQADTLDLGPWDVRLLVAPDKEGRTSP